MQGNDIFKVAGLLAGTLVLVGFIVWNVMRSGQLEERLFDELSEVAELDNELCPFDGSLTRTSNVLLFDFSDPLPAEAAGYPDTLLENMVEDLQDAERFDRFGMYTLNPAGNVPRNVSTFCVPVTMSQVPGDVRQALWGADPAQHAELPSRYERFSDVFELLWENDRELRESVDEAREMLLGETRDAEQGFSRIIENIEEIAGLEIDRESRRVNFVVLSNMLQNSPAYSHYRNRWDFGEYLSRRPGDLPAMNRFSFEIYLVQSCQSVTTDRRRALQQFWEDYFEQADASVRFRLLGIDGSACGPASSAAPPRSGQSPAPATRTANETAPRPQGGNPDEGGNQGSVANAGGADAGAADAAAVAAARELLANNRAASDARNAATADPVAETPPSGDAGASIPELAPCPAPEVRDLPQLRYPRNANGTALLRYNIELDDQGVPVEFEPYDTEIEVARHEQRFVSAANAYIGGLRFDVHADDDCSGGRTTSFALRYE